MFRSNLLGIALLLFVSSTSSLYGQIAVCAMDRGSRSCWSEWGARPNDVSCPKIDCAGSAGGQFYCRKQNPFDQAIQSVEIDQWSTQMPTMGPTLDPSNANYNAALMGIPTLFQCTIVRDCSICVPDRSDLDTMKCMGWSGGHNNNLRLATWPTDENLKRIKCPVVEESY